MIIEHPHLFVISGGPGVGKTTLLLELEKLGYRHTPEAARRIIQEQVKAGGTALPWVDREAYTALMLRRSIEAFENYAPDSRPSFADRGIPDTLAYARLIGLRDTAAIELACQRYRYAPLVFLAPPWEEIYRTDAERKQDFAEGERTYHGLVDVYQECGYRSIEVPKAAPDARAEFVLELALRAGGSR
jgi:predicted ATPase